MNRSVFVRALFVAAFSVSMLAHAPAQAGCFSVYNANNVLAFESGTSPIDLSKSISEEMARRFPSRYLVISTTTNCADSTISNLAPTRFGVGGFGGTSATSPSARRDSANPYDAPDQSPVRSRRRR